MSLRVLFLNVLIATFCLQTNVYGQGKEYHDSLFKVLEYGKTDTNAFLELSQSIKKEIFNDPDQALKDAKHLLKLAFDASYYRVVLKMIMYQGISYELAGNYDSAIIIYDSALQMARKFGFKSDEGSIYNNYSIVYSVLGQLELSIEYSMKALNIFTELEDSTYMAKVYNNIGSRYSEMGMYEQAIRYYRKAIRINERFGDHTPLARNYGNMGTVYSGLDENEKALENYTKAYMILKDMDNKIDMSITLSNMAISYKKMDKFDLALSFAEQSYLIAKEINDEIGKLSYFTITAQIYQDQEKYQDALQNYFMAEVIADSLGARQNLLEIYEGMAEIYGLLKDYEKAFIYNEKYNEVRISLLDKEKNRALNKIKEFEDEKAKTEIELLNKDAKIQDLVIRRQKILRNSITGVGGLILLIAILLWYRYRYIRKTKNTLAEKNVIIEGEKEKSDNLLLNILPRETAEELKIKGSSKARSFDMVTVLFTDFKGFTRIAEILSPEELVSEVDHCFKAFDDIISGYNIEKIKTIGDAYMCAGGLPVPNKTNPLDVVHAALDIRDFMSSLKKSRIQKGLPYFEIRIGVHTGPVVAGIVGVRKFQYDIWGDTVNIASRMESSGDVNEVNISGTTYNLIKEKFECVHRGKIEAKNKGAIDMYFVKKVLQNKNRS